MSSYDSQPGKTPGNDSEQYRTDDKPATITVETTSGETKKYDVEHHLRSENGWVSMWLTRDGGIDVQVPHERVISIERGREHHDDCAALTDPCPRCGADPSVLSSVPVCVNGHRWTEGDDGTRVAIGDYVQVEGDEDDAWRVESLDGTGARLSGMHKPVRREPVENLEVVNGVSDR